MNIRRYLISTAERQQYTLFFKIKSTDINLLSSLVCLSDKNGRFCIMIGQIACQSNSLWRVNYYLWRTVTYNIGGCYSHRMMWRGQRNGKKTRLWDTSWTSCGTQLELECHVFRMVFHERDAIKRLVKRVYIYKEKQWKSSVVKCKSL